MKTFSLDLWLILQIFYKYFYKIISSAIKILHALIFTLSRFPFLIEVKTFLKIRKYIFYVNHVTVEWFIVMERSILERRMRYKELNRNHLE